jgi:hypothetical protein
MTAATRIRKAGAISAISSIAIGGSALFQDPDFVQAWVDRWQQLRTGPFAQTNLNAVAMGVGAQIGNAAGARDAAKWPDNAASGGVYLNEIAAMKSWLGLRTAWIDGQMPAAPWQMSPPGSSPPAQA